MSTTTPLTARQRRRLAQIPWRFVVWAAFGGICWDAGALLFTGQSTTYSGAGYFWLRQMPGGMRTYGVALGILIVATVYAYGRSAAAPRDLFLRWCLTLLVVWYVGWTCALLWGWSTCHVWSGAGGLGRTITFAVICALAARFAPTGR